MSRKYIVFNFVNKISNRLASFGKSSMPAIFLSFLICFNAQTKNVDNTTINIVVSVPFDKPYIFRKELVEPAIDFALSSIKRNLPQSLRDYTFLVTYRDSNCSFRAAVPVVEFYYKQCHQNLETDQCKVTSPLLLLGPVCNDATTTVAAFARNWNVPVISTGSHAFWIMPTKNNSTLVRINPTHVDLALFMHKVFQTNHIGETSVIHLVFEDIYQGVATENDCRSLMEAVIYVFKSLDFIFDIEAHMIPEEDFNPNDLLHELGDPKAVLMCASGDKVREIMVTALNTGYAKRGVNSWYVVELHNDTHYAHGGWKRGDELDTFAEEAYQTLLVFTLRVSTTKKFRNFTRTMKQYYNKAEIDGSVNAYIEGFHDAILLYVRGLTETIRQGKSMLDGRTVTSNMKNLTFEGIAGPVTINEYGDKLGDYSLLSMKNKKDGKFEKILDYYGNPKHLILYRYPTPKPKLPEWIAGKDYNPNGRIPSPPNELDSFDYKALAGVLGSVTGIVMVCLLIAASVCCRKRSCSTSYNESALNNHEVIPIQQQEDESITTCLSTLEDDLRL